MTNKRKAGIFLLCALLVLGSIPVQPLYAKKFDKNAAKKKITVAYKKVPNGILVTYKNKNKTSVSLTAELTFLDADKTSMSEEKQKNLCLGAKCTSAFLFRAPLDSYGNPVNYSSYKASFSVAKSKYKNYSKKILVAVDPQTVVTNYTAFNQSGKKLGSIHATFVFYDGNGIVLACQTRYLSCIGKDTCDQGSIDNPYGIMNPAKVKVYVDWAY